MKLSWLHAKTLTTGLACALLAACGRTVTIQGTADEVWADTIEILGIQGVMPARVTAGQERPRVDRDKGEIDLVYTQSVYYGEGAAFIQVDVAHPARNAARTVRMWVDFPVGNRVVRYGRALDEQTTEAFAGDFEVALRKFRARNPPRRPPTPEEEAAMDAAERQAAEQEAGR
jgi:hypothetical protein